MHNKKRFRNDILLVTVIVVLAAIGFLIFKMGLKSGNTVIVTVNGEEKYRYDISENREFTVKTGKDGENINIVVIKDGKVYVKDADCRDQICVHHRPISKAGEDPIVCLPHKFTLSVEE